MVFLSCCFVVSFSPLKYWIHNVGDEDLFLCFFLECFFPLKYWIYNAGEEDLEASFCTVLLLLNTDPTTLEMLHCLKRNEA